MPNSRIKKMAGASNMETVAGGETGAISSDAMKLALEQVKKLAPALGDTVEGVLSGPIGAVVVLGTIVQEVKGQIAELNAELDKLAQQAAQPLNGGLTGLKKLLDDAAISKGEFSASLSHAGEDGDPIRTKLDSAKDLVQAQLEGQKQIIETLGQNEEERLRASGASEGQIEAAHASTQAKLGNIDKKIEQSNGSGALTDEQTLRKAAEPDLDVKVQTTAANELAAKIVFSNKQTEMQNLRNQLGMGEEGKDNPVYISDQKAIEDARNHLEAVKLAKDDPRHPMLYETESYGDEPGRQVQYKKKLLDAQSDLNKAIAAVAQKQAVLTGLEGSEQDRAKTVSNAIETANQARSEQLENTSRLQKLPGEISQAQAKEAIEEHTRQVIELLNAHGGKLNESLSRLATETGKSQQQTLEMVESIVAGQSTLSQRFSELEAQLKAAHNLHTSG